MEAYGSDRLAEGGDGSFILSCRLPKGWKPRVARTLTQGEFPGTAVLWDENWYEVIAAEPIENGIRYTLALWPDNHTIRVADSYDAASEQKRITEWRAHIAREKHRRTAILLGILAGHLPAVVQQHLGSELGVIPSRLSLASCIVELACFVGAALGTVKWIFDRQPPVPPWLIVLGIFAGVDAIVRLFVVLTQARPIGSPAGTLVYGLWFAFVGHRRGALSPFAVEKGLDVPILPAPAEVAAEDAFIMREPLITLLTPAEQKRAAERFGYDFRRSARTVAGLILLFSTIGVITSIRTLTWGMSFGALSSLAVAGTLAVEQIVRLAALRREPAGSILAPLARPFVRRYTA